MTTQSTRRWRLLALIVAIGLATAACTGGSDEPDEGPMAIPADELDVISDDEWEELPTGSDAEVERVEELCEAGPESREEAAFDRAVASVCILLEGTDSGFDGDLLIQPCNAAERTPRFFIGEPGEDNLVLFLDMMVRFFELDERTADPGYEPASIGTFGVEDGAGVIVIDHGKHLEFVAATADELVPGAVQSIDLVDVGNERITTIATVIDALEFDVPDAIERFGLDPEQIVVNMSFGAYNCGQEPRELKDAMVSLARQGVRFTASAGNDESNEPPYPAAWALDQEFDGLLGDRLTSVGSIETPREDEEREAKTGVRSCFSNYGRWVEQWFPGENVFVTSLGESWSGTSFAAPQVAALLAAGEGPAAFFSPNQPDQLDGWEITVPSNITAITHCGPDSEYMIPGSTYN